MNALRKTPRLTAVPLAPRASGITIETREQWLASLAKTQRIKGAK